jgi:uncharacterized protein YeaO (DUF488 family)
MSIQAKRISEAAPRSDGERILADRLHDALRRAREQARETKLTTRIAPADVLRRDGRPTSRRPRS